MNAHPRRERRLRIAAMLIAVGLFAEAVTLRWAHPTAFLVFAATAVVLVGGGALLFLTALFATGPAR
jgi:hypothetical protein